MIQPSMSLKYEPSPEPVLCSSCHQGKAPEKRSSKCDFNWATTLDQGGLAGSEAARSAFSESLRSMLFLKLGVISSLSLSKAVRIQRMAAVTNAERCIVSKLPWKLTNTSA